VSSSEIRQGKGVLKRRELHLSVATKNIYKCDSTSSGPLIAGV
jgi:hypothetical protein